MMEITVNLGWKFFIGMVLIVMCGNAWTSMLDDFIDWSSDKFWNWYYRRKRQ